MINLVYPELQFSSAALDRLVEADRQIPAAQLGLTTRTYNVLGWRGIRTLGELVEVLRSERGIGIVRNFGRKSHEEMVHAVLALSEAITVEGTVDWKKYVRLARIFFRGLNVAEATRAVGFTPVMPAKLSKRWQDDWPSPFGTIPEDVATRPLHTLPFSNRAYQGLRSMGVTTIGDAAGISPVELLKVKNVGRSTIREIFKTIMSVAGAQKKESVIPDKSTFTPPSYPIVPFRTEGITEQFYTDFFSELPSVIKKNEGTQEEHILRWRLFCPLGKAKTLQSLGQRFGITRERIRQKESVLIEMIAAALFHSKYTYMRQGHKRTTRFGKVKFRIQPKLQKICANLSERFNNNFPSIVKMSEWTTHLAKLLSVSPDLVAQHHTFWLNILKFRPVSIKRIAWFKNEDLVFPMKSSRKNITKICGTIARFNHLLLSSPAGITKGELLEKIECKNNIQNKKSSNAILNMCFKMSSLPILKSKNTYFPIYKKSIKLSSADLERAILKIIKKNGGHIKIKLLMYKMQEEFPSINNIKKSTIANLIAKSRNITSIGKTGYCKIIN